MILIGLRTRLAALALIAVMVVELISSMSPETRTDLSMLLSSIFLLLARRRTLVARCAPER